MNDTLYRNTRYVYAVQDDRSVCEFLGINRTIHALFPDRESAAKYASFMTDFHSLPEGFFGVYQMEEGVALRGLHR